MGNAITNDSRALWLAMRREGGWWTVKSLVRHWTPTFAPWEVEELLAGLLAGRYLVARAMAPRAEESFAVTSECNTLPGTEPANEEESSGN